MAADDGAVAMADQGDPGLARQIVQEAGEGGCPGDRPLGPGGLAVDALRGVVAEPDDHGRAGSGREPAHLGPFALAYLETLLRCADGRGSENPSRSCHV